MVLQVCDVVTLDGIMEDEVVGCVSGGVMWLFCVDFVLRVSCVCVR